MRTPTTPRDRDGMKQERFRAIPRGVTTLGGAGCSGRGGFAQPLVFRFHPVFEAYTSATDLCRFPPLTSMPRRSSVRHSRCTGGTVDECSISVVTKGATFHMVQTGDQSSRPQPQTLGKRGRTLPLWVPRLFLLATFTLTVGLLDISPGIKEKKKS